MIETTNPRRWLAAVALAAAVAPPAWARAQAGDGATCPGREAGSCAQGATCPDAATCPHAATCAQMGGHHHGGGMGPRRWDPKSVTQVQGKVEEVEAAGHHGHGVHLVLAVGSEKLEVRVGPDSYLAQQGLNIAPGDVLEVKGARLDGGGTPVMIAQELRKGGQVVTLRDADGTPRWAGPDAQR